MAERLLRLALSLAVAGAALAVGALVARERPFDALLPPPRARAAGLPQETQAPLLQGPRQGTQPPLPPDGVVTFRNARAGGMYVRSETGLDPESVRRFYEREMPRRGWTADAAFDAARARLAAPGGVVLSFLRPEARCIMSVEQVGANPTVVTVLVFGRTGSQAAGSGARTEH